LEAVRADGMSYNDTKEFEGRAYSGMAVGGVHDWDYPDGHWHERKVAPDRWDIRFESSKRRQRSAPVGSGAEPGTMYHWFLLGHQRVRKVDADTYQTLLEGTKWKVGHKRSRWRRWSSEYPEQSPARERTIQILEEALAELKSQENTHAPALESLLSPVPGTFTNGQTRLGVEYGRS